MNDLHTKRSSSSNSIASRDALLNDLSDHSNLSNLSNSFNKTVRTFAWPHSGIFERACLPFRWPHHCRLLPELFCAGKLLDVVWKETKKRDPNWITWGTLNCFAFKRIAQLQIEYFACVNRLGSGRFGGFVCVSSGVPQTHFQSHQINAPTFLPTSSFFAGCSSLLAKKSIQNLARDQYFSLEIRNVNVNTPKLSENEKRYWFLPGNSKEQTIWQKTQDLGRNQLVTNICNSATTPSRRLGVSVCVCVYLLFMCTCESGLGSDK